MSIYGTEPIKSKAKIPLKAPSCSKFAMLFEASVQFYGVKILELYGNCEEIGKMLGGICFAWFKGKSRGLVTE